MSDEEAGGLWVRVQASFFQDQRVMKVGPRGALAFLGVLTMAKSQGWRGGRLRVLDAEALAVHMNPLHALGPNGDAFKKSTQDGIDACLREGLLKKDDAGYFIPNWSKYQRDPTNAQRQSDYRDRQGKALRAVTAVTAVNNDDIHTLQTLQTDKPKSKALASTPVLPSKPTKAGGNGSLEGRCPNDCKDGRYCPPGLPAVICRSCDRGRQRFMDYKRGVEADEEQAKRAAEARLERPVPYDPNGGGL